MKYKYISAKQTYLKKVIKLTKGHNKITKIKMTTENVRNK